MSEKNNRDCQHGQLARSCRICELEKENFWLRGIIARNAMDRLKDDSVEKMFVTPQDVNDSLEVLYEWQRMENPLNGGSTQNS